MEMPSVIAFACQRCGHCCEGVGGIVLSAHDIERLGDHLALDREALLARFAEYVGGRQRLITGPNDYCIFYKQGCTVHPARPDVCRAWPYFRGNLLDEGSLELSKQFCPGIPASLSHADFVRQGLACLEREGLVGSAGADEANALQVADLMASLAKTDNTR